MADYSQIDDVLLTDVSQEYTLEDVTNTKKTVPIDNNDLSIEDSNKKITNKNLKNFNEDVDYSTVNDVKQVSTSIDALDNYEIRWIKNVTSTSSISESATPIEVLMSQEPDFMPNMYNIYFILSDNNSEATDIDVSNSVDTDANDTGRNILNTPFQQRWSLIGTRIDRIEFPQKKQMTGTIMFAGHTINKLVGRYERTTRLDLSIRLDQSMYVLDAFHALNADCWAAERKRKEFIESIPTHPLEGKNFYNFLGVAMRKVNGKGKLLNIIVEYDADYFTFSRYHDTLGTIGYGNESNISISPIDSIKKDRVQRYIFYDCRFLGRSSSIQFKNDSAEPLSATFPFVYRKALHVTADGRY